MKCIRKVGETKILRVDDEKAAYLVKTGEYQYMSKQEWKAQKKEAKS